MWEGDRWRGALRTGVVAIKTLSISFHQPCIFNSKNKINIHELIKNELSEQLSIKLLGVGHSGGSGGNTN